MNQYSTYREIYQQTYTANTSRYINNKYSKCREIYQKQIQQILRDISAANKADATRYTSSKCIINIINQHSTCREIYQQQIQQIRRDISATNTCVWIVNWLFNVTVNDISVIYVTAHRCAGGLKKKLDIRSGSQSATNTASTSRYINYQHSTHRELYISSKCGEI